MPQDTTPTFDIQPGRTETTHSSKKLVIIASIVLVILAALYISLAIKQKRAYEAYLRTPEGQLTALEATSQPVTSTPEERMAELSALGKSSGNVKVSQEELLKQLPQ